MYPSMCDFGYCLTEGAVLIALAPCALFVAFVIVYVAIKSRGHHGS